MTPAERAPAQSADVFWSENDKKHKGWTVQLHVGEEVIKYHLPPDRNAADTELVSLAVNAANEDGYALDPAAVKIKR
jgi:hypothetical protein